MQLGLSWEKLLLENSCTGVRFPSPPFWKIYGATVYFAKLSKELNRRFACEIISLAINRLSNMSPTKNLQRRNILLTSTFYFTKSFWKNSLTWSVSRSKSIDLLFAIIPLRYATSSKINNIAFIFSGHASRSETSAI